jgi:hypothetical protein
MYGRQPPSSVRTCTLTDFKSPAPQSEQPKRTLSLLVKATHGLNSVKITKLKRSLDNPHTLLARMTCGRAEIRGKCQIHLRCGSRDATRVRSMYIISVVIVSGFRNHTHSYARIMAPFFIHRCQWWSREGLEGTRAVETSLLDWDGAGPHDCEM